MKFRLNRGLAEFNKQQYAAYEANELEEFLVKAKSVKALERRQTEIKENLEDRYKRITRDYTELYNRLDEGDLDRGARREIKSKLKYNERHVRKLLLSIGENERAIKILEDDICLKGIPGENKMYFRLGNRRLD